MKALLENGWGLRSLAYYSAEADVCCLDIPGQFTAGETHSNSPCSQILHLDTEKRIRSLEIIGISTASKKVIPIPLTAEQKSGDIVLEITDTFEALKPEIHFSDKEGRLTLLYSTKSPTRCLHLGDSFVVGVNESDEVVRIDLLNILSVAQYKAIKEILVA